MRFINSVEFPIVQRLSYEVPRRTDWAVEYLRGKNRKIIERLTAFTEDGLGFSIISLAELYHGVYKSKDDKKALKILQDFLANMKILLIDEDAAKIYGQEISRLESQGQALDNQR